MLRPGVHRCLGSWSSLSLHGLIDQTGGWPYVVYPSGIGAIAISSAMQMSLTALQLLPQAQHPRRQPLACYEGKELVRLPSAGLEAVSNITIL